MHAAAAAAAQPAAAPTAAPPATAGAHVSGPPAHAGAAVLAPAAAPGPAPATHALPIAWRSPAVSPHSPFGSQRRRHRSSDQSRSRATCPDESTKAFIRIGPFRRRHAWRHFNEAVSEATKTYTEHIAQTCTNSTPSKPAWRQAGVIKNRVQTMR